MEELELFRGTSGPRNADVVVVGESWGAEEEAQGRPFVGQSGQLFRQMFAEAGIAFDDCFVTNVVSARPPGNELFQWFYRSKESPISPIRGLHPMPIVESGLETLYQQLAAIRPKLIIAAGNYALWALTNCAGFTTRQDTFGRRVPNGIGKWRGSQIYANALTDGLEHTPLLPVIHPAAIQRAWYERAITVHDLRTRTPKALNDNWRPKYPPKFLAPPTFNEAMNYLLLWESLGRNSPPIRLQVDLETKWGFTTCIGFASSRHFAMSIPFVRPTKTGLESYWTEEEEIALSRQIRKTLCGRGVEVEGQNFLYDIQYLQALHGCPVDIAWDTLLAQHLIYPGTPKDLVYLSSLYCDHHWYWKDDHKEWDLKVELPRLLAYNCEDCVRQFEVATAQRKLIPEFNLTEQWEEQLDIQRMALEMMTRGVKISKENRGQFALNLQSAMDDTGNWLMKIVPQHEVDPNAKTQWYRSDKQIRGFFGEQLGLRLPRHRKTGAASFGKEAIVALKEKHPEFTRLFEGIENFRKLRTFHKNFISAPLDADGRIRCSFGRTETFRFTSTENAFGRGTNLQNIPKGNEE